MTVTITSPATIFELAELSHAMTRIHWQIAKDMWRKGATYAFRADGQLVALAGLFPVEGGQYTELWFSPAPAAADHMGPIVRQSRLTLARVPYRGIYTIVRTEAGQRIARLLGFRHEGNYELGEVWRHGGHADGGSNPQAAEGQR